MVVWDVTGDTSPVDSELGSNRGSAGLLSVQQGNLNRLVGRGDLKCPVYNTCGQFYV